MVGSSGYGSILLQTWVKMGFGCWAHQMGLERQALVHSNFVCGEKCTQAATNFYGLWAGLFVESLATFQSSVFGCRQQNLGPINRLQR